MSSTEIASIVGGVSAGLFGLIGGAYLLRRYCKGGVCYARKRLDGQIAIVTGCNTGIGLETAAELARRGCTVIMACRNTSRMNNAKEIILSRYGSEEGLKINVPNKDVGEDITVVRAEQLIPMILDLSSIKSIKNFVQEFSKAYKNLKILICNAAIATCPYSKTEDGFEIQMGTNHLGHFLLTELLIPMIKTSKGRVVIVSSKAHYLGKLDMNNLMLSEKDYGVLKGYNNSKLANVMYAKHLGNRFGPEGPVATSVHPGVISTEITRHLNPFVRGIFKTFGLFIMKSAWEGSQTTLYCALSNEKDLIQGGYYSDCVANKPLPICDDLKVVEELAQKSYNLISATEAGKEIFKRKD